MSRGYKHTVHKERSGFKYTFNLTAWWEKWDLNLSMLQKLFDNSAAITLEKQLNHPSLMRMKIGTISKKEYWQWKWKSLSCVWLFVSPWTIYSPWNSPGQNTGVGSRSLLQGIFPTQGSNPYITIIVALQKYFKIMGPQLSNLKDEEVEKLKVPIGFLQML